MVCIKEAPGEEAYIKSLGRHATVPRSQEYLHVRRAQNGCPKAAAWLVRQHSAQILRIALRYKGRGLTLWDLYSAGRDGMFDAVERFKFDRDVGFMTYAGWWVRQRIQRAIMDNGRTIRLPANVHAFRRTITAAERALADGNRVGRPDDDDVAAHICARCDDNGTCGEKKKRALVKKVARLRNNAGTRETLSLDLPGPLPFHPRPRVEYVASDVRDCDPEANLDRLERREMVAKAFAQLSPREQHVLRLRFFEDRGLREIASTMTGRTTGHDVTPEYVRQISECALRKLRKIITRWYAREPMPL